MHSSSAGILKILSALSTGAVKYAVVYSTVKSLLEADQAARSIKSYVRCCVSSYSMPFTKDGIRKLCLSGINFVGCGYVYDSIEAGQSLVNSSGVCMKRASEDVCSVRWGGDKAYEGPILTEKDFSDVAYVIKASRLVSIHKDTNSDLLMQLGEALVVPR